MTAQKQNYQKELEKILKQIEDEKNTTVSY